MSIRDDIGSLFRSVRPKEGTYGIEIETEVSSPICYPSSFLTINTPDDPEDTGYKLHDPKMEGWVAKADGSLRNFGVEYVFKEPKSYEDALKLLDNFKEASQGVPFIKDPFSCSVHVHVNMWNETFLTLGNFIHLYLLFEGLLLNYSGEVRRSNLFALPTPLAEGNWKFMADMFVGLERGQGGAVKVPLQNGKYATLNLSSLSRIGSIELRSMRGTTDVSVLKEWLSIINDMLVYSRQDITPRDIVHQYRQNGPQMTFEVFGDRADALINNLPYHEVERILDLGALYAATLADVINEWRSLDKIFKKKGKSEAKSLSEIYATLVGNPAPEPQQESHELDAVMMVAPFATGTTIASAFASMAGAESSEPESDWFFFDEATDLPDEEEL